MVSSRHEALKGAGGVCVRGSRGTQTDRKKHNQYIIRKDLKGRGNLFEKWG